MSGIYIQNMKIPEEHGAHKIRLFVRADGTASIWGLDEYIPHEPLEVIPVPYHGRLIDADALITKVTDAAIKQPEIADVYYEQASKIGGWLYSMPTIIPADKED